MRQSAIDAAVGRDGRFRSDGDSLQLPRLDIMLVDENQFPGLTIKAPLLMDGLHEAAQTIGREVAYDGMAKKKFLY